MMKINNGVYLIAEAGVNHEGNMETAIKMIEEAALAGADAIKFQTYKAEKISSKNSPAYWDLNKEATTSQYELFKKYDSFNEEEYIKLAKACKENNIDFLSTPFDFEAANFLNPLMKAFKISSSDLSNTPFLRHIANFNKPVILSVGASTTSEIFNAVEVLESMGSKDISLLHCILSYPTTYENANLQLIGDLIRLFPNYKIGYSDHTLPDESMMVLSAAYLNGAQIIEKHFTLDKTLSGNDHYHAMDPMDIRKFKNNINLLKSLFKDSYVRPLECEKNARVFARRSIVAAKNINQGQEFRPEHFTFKRPGTGIPPQFVDTLIGRRAKEEVLEDQIITWDTVL